MKKIQAVIEDDTVVLRIPRAVLKQHVQQIYEIEPGGRIPKPDASELPFMVVNELNSSPGTCPDCGNEHTVFDTFVNSMLDFLTTEAAEDDDPEPTGNYHMN